MGKEDEAPEWCMREMKERYEKRRQDEIKEYGEEEYARRIKAKEAVAKAVNERAAPMVDEARACGFMYFRCGLNTGTSIAIVLQFADGKGKYYERSIGLEKLMRKHLVHPSLPEYCDVSEALHREIRSMDGIEMLWYGMKRKKVRVGGKDVD
jgi:hypothetical protein